MFNPMQFPPMGGMPGMGMPQNPMMPMGNQAAFGPMVPPANFSQDFNSRQ